MPRLPVYEQQTTPQGEGLNYFHPVAMQDNTGAALAGMGDAVGDLGVEIGKYQERQQNNEANAWYAKTSAEYDLQTHQDFIDAQNNAVPGAKGFTEGLMKRQDDRRKMWLKNAPNDKAKLLVEGHAASTREQYGKQSLNYEDAERNRYQTQSFADGADAKAKQISQLPDGKAIDAETEKALVVGNALIDGMAIPPDQKQKLKDAQRKTLLDAANEKKIDLDPTGYKKSARAYTGGFDSAVGVVMGFEGGYADNDGGTGAPVNYGINQKANPDIDVAKLTPEKAKAIYKERYWDAIGADKLSPDMQLVALDAAVNQGVGWTKKAIEQSGGDAQKLIALREEHYRNIAKNPAKAQYLDNWLNRLDKVSSRVGGGSMKTGTSTFDLGTYSEQQAWLKQADTLSNQRAAVARQELAGQEQDITAMARNGVVPQSVPTAEAYREAFGDEDGQKRFNDLQDTIHMGESIGQMKTMPISEMGDLLKQNEPKEGEGYAEAAQRYDIMQQAATQTLKNRSERPAEYVIESSPDTRKAYEAVIEASKGQDMAAIASASASYADKAMAEQSRLGIANPMLLTGPEKSAVLQRFNTQQDGGGNAAATIASLQAQWGRHWPDVYAQLVSGPDGERLPEAVAVIASMDLTTGGDMPTAKILAQLSTMKTEDLKKASGAKASDITDPLNEALADFRTSLINTQPQAGLETFTAFRNQAERLAHYYVIQGKGATEAAQAAANAVANQRYSFTDTYRVPKQYDLHDIERMANSTQRSIKPEEITTPVGAWKPADYVEAIRSDGYWVTDPEEKGLELHHNGVRVLSADGKPIFRNFDDLQKSGREVRKKSGVNVRGNWLDMN